MADKRRGGLGRGLEYLFAESTLTEPASVLEPTKSQINDEARKIKLSQGAQATSSKAGGPSESIVYIGLNDIRPNSSQPRKTFDQDALQELADSIKEHGVIQPVLLRPAAKGYELVAGERRWRAARLAGLKSIPAIVRELTERQNAFYALIENMQREDLNPIEEADGIIEIIGNYGLTQEEAAKVVGKSRSYVTNALRIAKLPADIREMVAAGSLSAGHARAIAGLSTEALQLEAAARAVKEGWSVRQIESYTGTKTRGRGKAAKGRTKSADVRAVEQSLPDSLGAKVGINGSEKQGRLEIEYYSREELDRLVELLMDIK